MKRVTTERPDGTGTESRGRPKRKVLITGAAGRIGSGLALHTCGEHDLRLTDLSSPPETLVRSGEFVRADLTDLAAVENLCSGIDTVVHLAGNPRPSAEWRELLGPNIEATYNVLTAAVTQDCRRVVLASSIHTVLGYEPGRRIRPSDPVNPLDLYGVSKCFAEAMGRLSARTAGLSVLVVRIGALTLSTTLGREERPPPLLEGAFVHPEDLYELFLRCIDVEDLHWGLFFGVSDNPVGRFDLGSARKLLGYAPRHTAPAWWGRGG